MKKFQQLLLAVISIFSFACLLIYRHEYNKLRYVLEVLNFFGTPGVPTSCPSLSIEVEPFQKFTRGPSPAWQRISDTLYVYSAYWETFKEERVKAFAAGLLNENLNYDCHLWYETNPKIKSGVFRFSDLPYKNRGTTFNKTLGKNKRKAFVLYCKIESEERTPIGVTFINKSLNQTHQAFIPVVSVKLKSPPLNSTGICIVPNQLPQYERLVYLEFLSFHKLIGINNFIIYGGIDHYNLLSSIQIDKSNKVKLAILPWNYPFFDDTEIMKIIAENDCISRVTGIFENVVVLEWNKFLVPRHILNIGKTLNELNINKKANKFHIPVLLFCMEYRDTLDSNTTLPVIFRKMRYSLPKIDIQVPIYKPHVKSGNAQKVGKDIMAVHHYTNCQDYKLKFKDIKNNRVDMTMLKYQNEFFKSQILII